MNSVVDNIKYQFKTGGMYLKLLYVNVAVFFAFWILEVIAELTKTLSVYMIPFVNTAVSSDVTDLMWKPWTVFTYMFVQIGFMHLLSNMLMLFFLGRILESYLGAKKVLSIYVLGGIAGVLLQVLAKNVFPLLIEMPNYPIIGASGAVFAISVALITYNPRLEVNLFGVLPVKLIWIVGGYFLLEFMNLSNISDGVAHFTHVGGGLIGFLIINRYTNGKDITRWFERIQDWVSGLFSGKGRAKKPKMKVKYSKYREESQKQKPPRDDYEYNASKAAQQEKLDKILDKIKVRGYDGLTKEEKDFLAKF